MMKRWLWMGMLMAGFGAAGLGLPGEARAAALTASDLSAAAVGVANAWTASADNAAAEHYNPAGIAWLPGEAFALDYVVRYENMSAKLGGGQGTPFNRANPRNLASLYATWMPRGGDWGAGFGFDLPFSLNTDWGSAFGGRAQRTKLNVLHLSLDAVYALNSSMAVAAGGDWYGGRVDVDSATTRFHGTDNAAFGGHVAWMWHPSPIWSVGAVFRSGSRLKLSGTATGAVSGSASTTVRLADVAQLGVARVFADRWRLEADARWEHWSAFNDLNVTGATGSESNPLNLRDAVSAMVGLTWFWREKTQFRFGYAFEGGATRKSGFNARVVDGDGHRLSLGAGSDLMGAHFDVAYSYIFYPARTVSGAFAGRYKQRRQTLAISVSKRF